jgi:hypothetical protein
LPSAPTDTVVRRRALLTALAAGVSGCGSRGDSAGVRARDVSDTQTQTSTRTQTDERAEPAAWVGDSRVVELTTGPRTLAAGRAFGGERLELRSGFARTATADEPAVLRATLTNHREYQKAVRLQSVPLFGARSVRQSGGAGGSATLRLVPTVAHELATETPGVERGPAGYWRAQDVPTELPDRVVLDPGETVYGEYYVVGHADREGFATGTYRFGHDPGVALRVWDTTTPGPTDDSRFAGATPPALGDDTVEWFHDADRETRVFLRPSAERVTPPGRLSFTVVNHTTERLDGNYYDWGVHKLVDGAWRRVEPWMVPVPLTPLAPGERHQYTVAVYHEGYDDTTSGDQRRTSASHAGTGLRLPRLGGGRYAFESNFGDGVAALFEVDAPPLTVSLPPETARSREGERVVVRDAKRRGADGTTSGSEYQVTVRVTRGDAEARADDDLLVVVPEQLYRDRYRGLRGALPAFESGVSTVEYRTTNRGVGRVTPGVDEAPRRVSFDGDDYVVRTDRE